MNFRQVIGFGVVLTVVMGLGQIGRCRAEMPDFSSSTPSVMATRIASATPVDGQNRVVAEPQIQWFDSLESGWKAARETGRPMVIFITSEHCAYCDAMKKNTLCESSVRDRLLERFIPIRLRPDSNAQVLSRVEVTAFPTTLVALPRGKVVAHRIGYQPVDQFHQFLSEVATAEMPTTVTDASAASVGAIR